MCSSPAKSTIWLKNARRRTSRIPLRRRRRAGVFKARGSPNNGGKKSSLKVSAKLKALKNLIPSGDNGEFREAEELFRETADYIVLLKTQVTVLQRLIQFYGSEEKENEVL